MADSTEIEWARHPLTNKGATWQIVTGCQIVSPGCTYCYAMKLAGTRLRNHPSRAGLTAPGKKGPVWTGEVRFNEAWLTQPLRWRDPRGIFVAAHGDLFAEGITDAMLDRIFAVMALCPQHIFFVLTKRPERMRDYLSAGSLLSIDDPANPGERIASAAYSMLDSDPGSTVRDYIRLRDLCESGDDLLPLQNVWLGVSVEDQQRADERRQPMLDLAGTGWTTFVSYEPALGLVDWSGWEFLKWMISGGESGPRPTQPDWHRAARDFCAAHGIAYFFKQWGSYAPTSDANGPYMMHVGKKAAGHLLDGREHFEFPRIAV